MRMSMSDFQEIYPGLAAEMLAASGEACPPAEDLLRCLTGNASKRERERVVGHLTRCASCAADARVLMDVGREERLLVRDIEKALRPVPFYRRIGDFVRRPTARPAAIFALVIVAAALTTLSVFLLSPKRSVLRGSAAEVRLVSPAKSSVKAERVALSCRAYPEAKAYVFELFDSELALVWRSEAQAAPVASPPKAVLESLKPGGTYFWTATAVLANDSRVKSKLTEFKISK